MSENETKGVEMYEDMSPAHIAAIAAVANRPEYDAMTDEQFETAVRRHMLEHAIIGHGPLTF